jgi:hypothetical protein
MLITLAWIPSSRKSGEGTGPRAWHGGFPAHPCMLVCLISTRPAARQLLRPKAALDTMKVTIKEWNAVAAWRWDMPDDDVCGICRNPYDSTCSKCKYPGDDCPLCKPNLHVGRDRS